MSTCRYVNLSVCQYGRMQLLSLGIKRKVGQNVNRMSAVRRDSERVREKECEREREWKRERKLKSERVRDMSVCQKTSWFFWGWEMFGIAENICIKQSPVYSTSSISVPHTPGELHGGTIMLPGQPPLIVLATLRVVVGHVLLVRQAQFLYRLVYLGQASLLSHACGAEVTSPISSQ